jgi:putative tricarboxylic transport membrane protein
MKRLRFAAHLSVTAAAFLIAGTTAMAADYPNRPITVVVPYSAGGSTDAVGRTIARVAEKYLGQPFVIANKPGAGGMIGLNAVVEAKPDGYTIGITNSGLVTQALYGNNKHDYPTALAALGQVGEIPFVFAVGANAPWKTLGELVDFAKANPKKVKYGITGVGNTAHIGPKYLELETKIEMASVNFDGGAPMLAALLGGHIDGAANNPVDLRAHLMAKRARVLAVFGEKRLEFDWIKEAPTARELGYDIIMTLWQGVGGPQGMPADIKAKLAEGIGKIIQDPETKKAIANLGLNPVYLDADTFAKKWISEKKRMGRVVTDTGILALIKSQVK